MPVDLQELRILFLAEFLLYHLERHRSVIDIIVDNNLGFILPSPPPH